MNLLCTYMLKGFSTRIVVSVCIVLILLLLLISLTESWGDNILEAACSTDTSIPGIDTSILGTDSSIIRTDGTNRADLMLGCNTPDIIYGKSGNDVLQGRSANDRLYGDCGDDLDVIVDFEPSKGDTHTNNCEDIREHL